MQGEIVKGVLLPFFTALGVMLGGSLFGGLAALFYPESPFHRMRALAADVKLWAIVVAIGGTFPTLRALDSGLFNGEATHLIRQLGVIVAGFLGAQTGYWIVMSLTGGRGG
ncbi:MAG: YtrH family sporulation protein [Limnochordales bacterium]|nr:YtrH family sporulation protein [Limnochordales bacterium]